LGRTGWSEEERVPGGVILDGGDEEDRTIDGHGCGAERWMSIPDWMTGVVDRVGKRREEAFPSDLFENIRKVSKGSAEGGFRNATYERSVG
jgi:hypothetical protein